MVTADENCIMSVERIYTDVLRWHCLEVDVSSAVDLVETVRLVGLSLEKLIDDETTTKPFAVRVVLKGQTAAHGDIFGDEARLRAEILGLSASLAGDRIWIEKVRLETSPAMDAEMIRARADAIADLQVFLDAAPTDPVLLASLSEDLRTLVDRAPHELSDLLPELKSIRSGEMGSKVASIIPGLVAHLVKAS